jgi:thiol-disulfide isomerase/thioredoxin
MSPLVFISASAQNDPPSFKLIVFEGTDWCAKCIRLETEILSDTTFVNFIKSNKIQLERIDFPQRKQLDKKLQKHNDSVAEKYNFDGSFPTLMLVEPDSEIVHKINYSDQNADELISLIRSKISPTR